jgi:hypothetical protein
MIRFGVLLVVLGFGSVLFHYTDYQFRVPPHQSFGSQS